MHTIFDLAEDAAKSKGIFSSNREIPIGGKIISAIGAKGFQTREVCRRHESFSPIGISPIGEKFHSLRSPRSLCETSFHLIAATPLCDLCDLCERGFDLRSLFGEEPILDKTGLMN